MKSLSYGVMPKRSVFIAEVERQCIGGVYKITHGAESRGRERPDAGSYSGSELFAELERLCYVGTDEATSWCSDILGMLGWEWI